MLAVATKSNPDEYDSAIATYKVRRPYAPYEEETFWKDIGELTNEEYQNMANVQDPFSLEVAAQIKADGSVLLLHGISDCRHKKKRAKVWRLFDNVDERDQPLGSVQFIDANANEGEYWLDEIFEEAMSTRDTYCSSLLSTVAALSSNPTIHNAQQPPPLMQEPSALSSAPPSAPSFQQQGSPMMMPSIPPSAPNFQQPPVQQSAHPPLQPPTQPPSSVPSKEPEPTQEHARETLPAPDAPVEKEKQNVASVPKKDNATISRKKRDLPHEDDGAQSNDLLSNMLGSLFYGIFCFIWFTLVTIPMKAFQWGFIATVFGIAYSMAWFYFAEDDGYDFAALSGINQANIS